MVKDSSYLGAELDDRNWTTLHWTEPNKNNLVIKELLFSTWRQGWSYDDDDDDNAIA